jgi:hypothetical protein
MKEKAILHSCSFESILELWEWIDFFSPVPISIEHSKHKKSHSGEQGGPNVDF